MFRLKNQKLVEVVTRQLMAKTMRNSRLNTARPSMSLMTLCLIWQVPALKIREIQKVVKTIRKLQLNKPMESTSTKMVRLRTHGSEKRRLWGKNLKKAPLTNLSLELLSKIDKLEAARHNLLHKMIIMIAIWSHHIKTILILRMVALVLLIQLRFNWILNKLKKLSKWHMEKWGNSEEIDYMLVTEIDK